MLNQSSMFFGAIGALLAALGVIFGAFGAHGLRSSVSPELLQTFDTGIRYHMYHSLALIAVALIGKSATPSSPASLIIAGWCFVAGVVLFSGSLYLLVLTGHRWLGVITPVGGVFFVAGWLLTFHALIRQ